MAVTVQCEKNDLGVGLQPTSQQLRYTLEPEGDIVFTLRNEVGTLLDDTADPLQRLWPLDASEVPTSTHVVHVIAMTFGQGGTLRWLVEKLDGTDEVVVKDCSYSSQSPGDKFFDALHIFAE
jgi:hypothetical protein